MQSQRTRDTGPELALRRELHRRGLRYRLQRKPVEGLRRTLDIVFLRPRVAVDVRGCFWHGCIKCKTIPKANHSWWADKIAKNRARDRATEAALGKAGWDVIVVWEHDICTDAADRIENSVRQRTVTRRVHTSAAVSTPPPPKSPNHGLSRDEASVVLHPKGGGRGNEYGNERQVSAVVGVVKEG
jgi:DNA mismatch endonuclease, patch repair protein